MPRNFLIVFLCLLIAASISYFALTTLNQDLSLTKLQEADVIRIGYAIEAPYAFLTDEGEITGEAPEVARHVVAELGITHIAWRLSNFNALIDELRAGRIDVIAAGQFITPERARLVNFSTPSFHVQQGLLVARGNPHQFHSYEQAIKSADSKIAVLSGSVEEALLRQMGAEDSQLLLVPDSLTGKSAVQSGAAQSLALSLPSVKWMAINNQLNNIESVYPFVQPEQLNQHQIGFGAFAFRKEDRQLLTAWNNKLTPYIGSPEHLKLVAKFGLTREELPLILPKSTAMH